MVSNGFYPRHAESQMQSALRDSPVTLVHGPRQSGKTTLTHMVCDPLGFDYVSFDEDAARNAARSDPTGFIANLTGPVILDEVQRVSEIFTALKLEVDRDRSPGRFVLTGSTNLMRAPNLLDSLAGRMEVVQLRPLAQSEIERVNPSFLDDLFSGDFQGRWIKPATDDVSQRIIAGGFPPSLARPTARGRANWYFDYVEALVQRDLLDVARIRYPDALRRLLSAAAAQTAGLFNSTKLASPLEVSRPTVDDYVQILEAGFLLDRLPPWSNNRLSRVVKTSKLHMTDTGLCCALLGIDSPYALSRDRMLLGQLLETFAYQELKRQSVAHDRMLNFYHYRDRKGGEVDIVIERGTMEVAGVEMKASRTVASSDFRGLRKLRDVSGDRFTSGVVLYDGDRFLSFDESLYALPIRTLWDSARAERRINLAALDESIMWGCEIKSSPQCRGSVELHSAFKHFDGRDVIWICESCYVTETRSWVHDATPNLLDAVRLAKAIQARDG